MTETYIQTLYTARLDYQGDWETTILVENAAFDLGMKLQDLDVEAFSGGPACHPYVEATSEHRSTLELWVEGVQAIIKEQEA